MKVLAIETSCDETGVAIVEGTNLPAKSEGAANGFDFTVLSSALLSQASLHSPYGGVYPNLAKREHIKNLPVMLQQAVDGALAKLPEKKSSGSPQTIFSKSFATALDIDAIAVTRGPGLEPALWTGIEFAKKLAAEWGLPLIPVNHMEGHLLSSLAQKNYSDILENTRMILEDVKLPVLALLISGGHTEFVLMRDWFNYEILGQTLDDAVGEAFDKVARMLALPYPGGPEISKLAEIARAKKQKDDFAPLGSSQHSQNHPLVSLPRPMIGTKDNDVSFSGLKTAVLYALRDRGGIQKLSAEEITDFAREFEDATTDVLVHKTRRALEETGAQTFVIGGGVAANKHIRESLEKLIKEKFNEVEMRLPELGITGDNAVMIAEAALARALSGKKDATGEEIVAKGNLSISSLR